MKILYCSDILNEHDRCLLAGFAESGHETALATFYHRATRLPSFTSPFRTFRRIFETFPDGVRGSRFGAIRRYQYRRDEREAIRSMKRWLDQWSPDVVFASWAITSGYVASRAVGREPLALFPWGSDVLTLPQARAWYRKRAVTALRGARLWVFNARHTAERARELAGTAPRVEILPLELDSTKFAPDCADRSEFESLWPGIKVVMTTRPLKELYDPGTIIRAMKKIDAALYVAGDGPLRESLEVRARGDVHFAGAVDHDKLPPLLAACDVYVSAARSDSASLGVFEAMSCARPVVAADIPATREWIEDGRTGRLFRPGDADDLAAKLKEALAGSGSMGQEARRCVIERADRRTNFPKLIAALEQMK